MSTNVDATVRAGVDAYKAGNKAEARTLLERAIEMDGYNETAWLWLSAVVETPEEQQTCLENVLVINPENDRAKKGLKSLGVDPDTVLNQDTAEEDDYDPYAIPTSSASSEFQGPKTTADDYDDWVDGLNLGNSDPAPAPAEPIMSDDLFGDIDFSNDSDSLELDDGIFGDDDFEDYASEAVSDDFAYGIEDTIDNTGNVDDALFDEDVFDDGDDMYADISTFEAFTDAVGATDDYDERQFAADPYAPPKPKPQPNEKAPPPSPEELFASIPSNIKATRSPGISESTSKVHYVGIGILALINIAALVFIALAFIA